ncbi:hypothetical protein OE165_28270, partial [Escherichia coli]|uniref:hypothetical protein n=1 Tax=Escherichia coli TaxID=562 RepID=UPI0021F3332C
SFFIKNTSLDNEKEIYDFELSVFENADYLISQFSGLNSSINKVTMASIPIVEKQTNSLGYVKNDGNAIFVRYNSNTQTIT